MSLDHRTAFGFAGTAPGNDVIRIKSFEILPLDGSNQITIETGVLFRLKFMCYKENAMLATAIEIRTLDDIIICQPAAFFCRPGEKDSKIGLYTMDFVFPAYMLNAGSYKADVFFGENQKYVIFDGFEQRFMVENTLTDMGYNQSILPGVLRPKNNFKVTFEKI